MTTYQGGKQRIGKKIYEVIKLIEQDIYECDSDYDSDSTDSSSSASCEADSSSCSVSSSIS